MRFPRWIFAAAGIYGFITLSPLFGVIDLIWAGLFVAAYLKTPEP